MYAELPELGQLGEPEMWVPSFCQSGMEVTVLRWGVCAVKSRELSQRESGHHASGWTEVLCQCRMGMLGCEALFYLCIEQLHGLKAKSSANLRF